MAEAIPSLSELIAGTAFSPLAPDVRAGWSRFNPSLARRHDGALMANVRSSNYRIGAGGTYQIEDADHAIRTHNHLVELDQDLQPLSAAVLREPPGLIVDEFPVHGYEDVRLFATSDGLGALATVRDRGSDGICRIALLAIAADGQVTSEHVLAGPDPFRHEKNWIPVGVIGHILHVVYGWSPFIATTVDLDSGATLFGEPIPTPLTHARGGAGGVRIGDERLFIVHEAHTLPDWSRSYVHRFVTVDDDDRPSRASRHFYLMGRGIEFAAGLDVDETDALVAFGLEDEEAWIARLPIAGLLALLEPMNGVTR